MQNGSCGGRPPPIAPGLHPLGYSLYPPLYLPRRLGPGGLRERSPPGTAKGPRREERSPLARPGDQPTEGRGRAGRGRGRPGGSRRGFGAEGPGGSPPWRGGRAVRPTRSRPRASPRTECRSRPSRPRSFVCKHLRGKSWWIPQSHRGGDMSVTHTLWDCGTPSRTTAYICFGQFGCLQTKLRFMYIPHS